jgi:4-methylaminobutanoate oxidase (formaldehyde-forming)
VPGYLDQRCVDAYGHYYAIAFPNRELTAPRGQRRSPLYDVLAARGAVTGAKFGWERASWFAPPGTEPAEELSFGCSNAWPHIGAEHRAVREGVGIVDLSSFAKYEISGRGALPLLQKVAGADLDVRPGKIVYTQLLNERGGIEGDVTFTRLDEDCFYFVTGAGFGRHDIAFILRHAPDDGSVTVRDVTSGHGVLSLCGPRARDVAQQLSRADLGPAAFGYMTARRIDLGHAPVLALRASYVGELGWEFHVPAEYLRDLYDRLLEAGAAAGIRDVGYRAVNSLRLEKQYLAWSADITSDDNPYAAGLGFAVRPDKPGLLAGQALRKIRDEGPRERLCWFSAGPEAVMHGGELLAQPGSGLLAHPGSGLLAQPGSGLLAQPGSGLAASVRSAGYGYTVGRTIFSAYLPVELAGQTDFIVEVAGEHFPATRHDRPLYDPAGTRIRC